MDEGAGLLFSALAGGVAGAGKGMTEIADKWNDRETEELKQQRVIELKQLDSQIAEQSAAKESERGLVDYAAKKNIDIAAATNPKNVQAVVDAEIQKKRGLDQYADERWPIESQRAKEKYLAEHPFEQAKYELDFADVQSKIEERIANAKTNEEKQQFEIIKVGYEGAVKQMTELMKTDAPADEAGQMARNQQMMALQNRIKSYEALLNRGAPEAAPEQTPEQKALIDSLGGGKKDSAPTEKPASSPPDKDKKPGLISQGLDKARLATTDAIESVASNDDQKLIEQAKIYLKQGPGGTSTTAAAINRIRNDKTLSASDKLNKIVALLKSLDSDNSTDSAGSALSDYGQLFGLK